METRCVPNREILGPTAGCGRTRGWTSVNNTKCLDKQAAWTSTIKRACPPKRHVEQRGLPEEHVYIILAFPLFPPHAFQKHAKHSPSHAA